MRGQEKKEVESPEDLLHDNIAYNLLRENSNGEGFLGIPGTTQTKNGYDTALGNQSICWLGAAPVAEEKLNWTSNGLDSLVKQVFPNPLVENFVFGRTEILEKCPEGNGVQVEKPIESLRGEHLRTMRYYSYTLEVDINLDSLKGDEIVTDNRTATIALQIVVCSLGRSGFCSPFVHEQGVCSFLQLK